jgi:hypothetical protein
MKSYNIVVRLLVTSLVATQLCDSLNLGRPQFTKPPKKVSLPMQTALEETDIDVELPKFVVETNKFAIGFVKDILGVIYGDRHYARFAALETIARVPYFSCKSGS